MIVQSPSAALRIVAVVTLLSLPGVVAAQGSRACSVSAIEGAPARVEVAGRWSALEVGPLRDGSRLIVTGPGARCEIRCSDGLILTLGGGIEVVLEGLIGRAGPSESVVLRLLRGIIGIDAPNRTWQSFQVHTPLAIASARTTSWLVEYAELTGAGFFVRSGSIDVAAVRGEANVRLSAGNGITILPGVLSAEVVRWSATRIGGAGATLGFGWR